jgi:hypothetical protein
MAIFYWVNQGRLGNLLFQYAAILRSIGPRDSVWSFYNELFDLLDIDPRFRMLLGKGRRSRQVSYIVNPIAGWAVERRIVSSLLPTRRLLFDRFLVESGELLRCSRWPGSPVVVQGFFQFAELRDQSVRIKPTLIHAASSRLRTEAMAEITVGVHIRLTDYGDWTVLGAVGTLVPADWYRGRMNALRARLTNPRFVVFSDDISAAKRLDLGDDLVYFQGSSAIEDFTALALCDHTIVSPSSFAWWAAFARPNPAKIIMAPTYWAGFKSRQWYPLAIQTESIEYYPLDSM